MVDKQQTKLAKRATLTRKQKSVFFGHYLDKSTSGSREGGRGRGTHPVMIFYALNANFSQFFRNPPPPP